MQAEGKAEEGAVVGEAAEETGLGAPALPTTIRSVPRVPRPAPAVVKAGQVRQ